MSNFSFFRLFNTASTVITFSLILSNLAAEILAINMLLFLFFSVTVDAQMTADQDLCDGTIAALQNQWDKSHGEMPVDEQEMKKYKARLDFARQHRDFFEKTLSLYDQKTLQQLIGPAKKLYEVNRGRKTTNSIVWDDCPRVSFVSFESKTLLRPPYFSEAEINSMQNI